MTLSYANDCDTLLWAARLLGSPNTANKLLKTIKELKNPTLNIGRGFPMIETNGIDSLLNLHYQGH